MEGKTIFFRGAYRLSGTGIVERLEITDVGCNLKQFDGLTWLTLTPSPYFTTYLRRCPWQSSMSPISHVLVDNLAVTLYT